jgi:hypothetical protein
LSSFRRTRDLVLRVVLLICVVEPPQYAEIIALDARIRANWVSSSRFDQPMINKIGALKCAIICAPFRFIGEVCGSAVVCFSG